MRAAIRTRLFVTVWMLAGSPTMPVCLGQTGDGAARPGGEKHRRAEVFQFTAKPTVKKQGDAWEITFVSKAACDATVSIIDPKGRVICHLASGVLGKNAPYPFQQDSLKQVLIWDGKTDQGERAPAGCKVRVGLGLKAALAWIAPMIDAKTPDPIGPQRNLTGKELEKWPKYETTEGEEVLVPQSEKKKLWDENRRQLVSVDPIREEVYVSCGQVCFNGTWRRLDGKTGNWDPDFRMSAMNVAIHPNSGLLYVRDMKTKKGYDRDWGCHFLSRRDHDGTIIKFTIPEADAEGEIFMPSDRSAKNFGDGMAFSPNGDLYVLTDIRRYPSVEFKGRPGPSVIVYDAEGNQKPYRKTVFVGNAEPRKSLDKDGNESKDFGRLVQVPAGGSCGIGADRFGNFYVGSNGRPLNSGEERVFLPEDLAGSSTVKEGSPLEQWLIGYTGSVLKFGRKGATLSSTGDPTHWYWGNGSQVRFVRLAPVLWTYVGITPITTKTMGCICQQARISVDGWGRVLVPQIHRQSILILDSNANTVLRVGSFGTLESKGPRIYFTTPKYCGASDTALYVADRALGRVVKVDLTYSVEETMALR